MAIISENTIFDTSIVFINYRFSGEVYSLREAERTSMFLLRILRVTPQRTHFQRINYIDFTMTREFL